MDVSLGEFDVRDAELVEVAPGCVEHPRRVVEADDVRGVRGETGGHEAATGPDIHAGRVDASTVKAFFDEVASD